MLQSVVKMENIILIDIMMRFFLQESRKYKPLEHYAFLFEKGFYKKCDLCPDLRNAFKEDFANFLDDLSKARGTYGSVCNVCKNYFGIP
jgi:hypothetical protein